MSDLEKTPQRLMLLLLTLFLAAASYQLLLMMTIRTGYAGYDYSYFLPRLFEGLLFYKAQGLAIPWYSVSFCGGLPYYGDPQSMYYSLPQLLTLLVDPWSAVQLSSALFLAVGGLGFYLLLSRTFGFDLLASVIGAALFATNGFFKSRMMIGHLTYQTFALIPLLAYVLLDRRIKTIPAVVAISFLGAYFVHSGSHFTTILAGPSVLAIILCLYLLSTTQNHNGVREIISRCIWGGLGAALLSASKLAAVYSFMRHFPRRQRFHRLESFQDAAELIYSQLFDVGSRTPFRLGIWEYDCSITPFALVGVALGIWALIRLLREAPTGGKSSSRLTRLLCLVMLVFLLVAIFQLIAGQGFVFRSIRAVPLMSSLRANVRFTAIFLFPLLIFSSFGFHHLNSVTLKAVSVPIALCFALLNGLPTRYIGEAYMSLPIESVVPFYQEVKNASPPELRLRAIDVPRNDDLQSIVQLKSNPTCYTAIFSKPPKRRLTPGPVERKSNGYFNLINPSCYAYPEENGCKPKSLIPVHEAPNFERLISHRNPNWAFSKLQRISNYSSYLTLASFLLFFLLSAVRRVFLKRKDFSSL